METKAAHKEKADQIKEVENQMIEIKKFVQIMVGSF
jgi:hypothetical protein